MSFYYRPLLMGVVPGEALPPSRHPMQPTNGNVKSAGSPEPGGPGQGVVLRTGFFALDWTLRFTRTTVTLDGHSFPVPWGEHFFPLEPGRHRLQVSYPYLRLSQAGKASALLDVAPDQSVQVSYQAPKSVLVAFLPGKLTVEAPAQS
jgi:hypothetical protein